MLNEIRTPSGASRSSLGLLAALAAASVALSLFIVTPRVWLDDPFIGYRYATNLVEGHGLVYNPGDPIEGYTAFGWILLAYVGMVIGTGPLAIIQVVSVAAQVATLGLIYAMGRSSSPSRSSTWSLLAPALLAIHVSFVTWPMMGMSTSFIALLVTVVVALEDRRAMDRPLGSLAMGAVLLTMCLTRFDGLVLSAIIVAHGFFVAREAKKWIPALVVLGIGLLVYNAWRIGYYGDLLPNTFHAKQSDLRGQLVSGSRYVLRFALKGGPFALLLVLLPLAARGATRTMKLAAWVSAAHLLYVVAVGGDWMVYYRFVLPVLPLIAFLLQESLWRLRDASEVRLGAARGPVLGGVLAVVLALDALPLLTSRWMKPGSHSGTYWIPSHAETIGEHLDDALPPDALVATEWAGILPFHMRQPILDIFGLGDRDISSKEFPGSPMGRGITPEYLVERAPDLVVVVARIFPTAEEAAAGIDMRPEGTWIREFYASLRDPRFGYELCVVRIGDRGYWPVLIRPGFPGRERLCVKVG